MLNGLVVSLDNILSYRIKIMRDIVRLRNFYALFLIQSILKCFILSLLFLR